jgi:glutamine amidotransferase
MIAILDYDMGNLRSVQKGFEHVGAEAQIITDPDQIARADKVVLPGQGAFKDAIARFRSHGLGDALNEHVLAGKPMLGICLGLQLLFERSYEDGEHEGLRWYRGEVVRFDFAGRNDDPPLRIPQMGWNQITWQRDCPLLAGVPQGSYVYFAHSYHVEGQRLRHAVPPGKISESGLASPAELCQTLTTVVRGIHELQWMSCQRSTFGRAKWFA